MESSTRPAALETAGEVLVTWPDYEVDHPEIGGVLAAAGLALRLEPKRGARSAGDVRALATGAAAAIVSTDPFDAETFEACPRLRVIARVGVGVDSIDLAAATRHGVAVTVTPGANAEVVADHTLALMLGVVRRVREHDAGVRDGAWNRTGPYAPHALVGLTVGLVGYGNVGRLVAARLRGFGVSILISDPDAAPDAGVEAVSLDELLRRSDVVSLHCPLHDGTRNLIGARELEAMGRDAILVNVARGGVVDEQALVAALADGRLRGAALDVFEHEPPAGSPLLELPNVLLSPHIAGISVGAVHDMTRRATASVVDVLSGRAPAHLANPEVLELAGAARAELVDGAATDG